ncbi:MAG: nucleotide exchange factor GrpE, partial [Candidatus Dadabacteria bacterium]|nr:nucleotide exchange factor GrpE [Candidatus Dadabacteria bacterium]NIT13816.1 nucleotide exchange factor GrpE [Candidatus Dadabacteria bacterium]
MTDDVNNDKDISNEEITMKGSSDDDQHETDNLPDEDPNEKLKALQQNLDEKNSSYNDLYERYLRIAADFDNYKKRMSKEKTDLVTYGNEELIKALLNVIDNLERALEHSDTEGSADSIIKGVDLVYRQFLSCLEKFGLSKIEAAKGTKFDPNYHQAVEHVETDDITPGLIVNEMIKGYLLKERLLRPSMVAVSKGISNKTATDKATDTISKIDTTSGDDELKLNKQDDAIEIDDQEPEIDLNNIKINEDFEFSTERSDDNQDSETLVDENEFQVQVNI